MSYFALWVDHKHAFIYKFDVNGVEETKYEAEQHEHHTHNKNDMKDKGHNKFYHMLCEKLYNAKEVFVMGPGTAKDEFKHHCEKHHHKNLFLAIKGMETMVSHPSKPMMLKKASEFFDSYHQWTKNY